MKVPSLTWQEQMISRLTVQMVLSTLTPREEKVLVMRFGLDGQPPAGLQEVADNFKLSIERARQIQARGLRKLRHPSRSESFIKGKFTVYVGHISKERAMREANERYRAEYERHWAPEDHGRPRGNRRRRLLHVVSQPGCQWCWSNP